jgi:ubiquinone/menaquinone biosynthesis C-methylase UbiE
LSASFHNLFDRQACNYAKYRPGYPLELFAFIANQTRQHHRAWDAGAGNGQAAVLLAGYFDEVVATDSSAVQIAHAHPHPQVTYRVAPAEASQLPDESCDAVIAANAVHWFDTKLFFAEARRVLKPDGVIAVWCYTDVCAQGALKTVVETLKEKVKPYWPAPIKIVADQYKSLEFPFEEIMAPPFQMSLDWTFEHCLGYLSTWSATQKYITATGTDPIADLRAEFPQLAAGKTDTYQITFPLPLRMGRKQA